MHASFEFTIEISELSKVDYRFVLLDDLQVRLTEVILKSRRNNRCRTWSSRTWRANGHKDFDLTHVPMDAVSAAIEHFKRGIHWKPLVF